MDHINYDSEETTDRTTEVKSLSKRPKFDKLKHRYPYCIVWTPLPLISWFLPIIGHTGICTYTTH